MAVRIATTQNVSIADDAKWDFTPVTQSRSCTLWFRVASDTSFYVCSMNQDGGNKVGLKYESASHLLVAYIFNSSWSSIGNFSCPLTVTTDTWYHLAFVLSSAGNNKIYVNGSSQTVTDNSWDDTTAVNPSGCNIGDTGDTGTHDAAHFKWWTGAISQAYVTNDMNGPYLYDTDATCLCSLHFDEMTGTNVADSQTGNTKTAGTLNNATWVDFPRSGSYVKLYRYTSSE